MQRPLIITMGDPTGIGPEIIVKAALRGALPADLLVAGDPGVLERAAAACGVTATCQRLPAGDLASHRLALGTVSLPLKQLSALPAAQLRYGAPDAACGRAMADYIEWACDRCLDRTAAGMVTAPISKYALQLAGVHYPGHTELLAERCKVTEEVMMLAGERLRVCMVTTHCALGEVPQRLTSERILATLRIVHADLVRHFGLKSPRLAVLALNPHAGESGLFGDEEARLIAPAIRAAQAEGIVASGPHSADTLFWFAVKGDHDAVICMYHDQGLIPLKLLHFEDAVNVTLGLPIVRTSVDHGTAYDLAGTGQANPASLIAATRMAAMMAANTNS